MNQTLEFGMKLSLRELAHCRPRAAPGVSQRSKRILEPNIRAGEKLLRLQNGDEQLAESTLTIRRSTHRQAIEPAVGRLKAGERND